MQFAAHAAAQGGVDELVLLDARFARECGRYHRRGIVVAVAREVVDPHLGTGNAFSDQGGDIVGGTPGEFADFIARETVKWAQVVKAAGVKAE